MIYRMSVILIMLLLVHQYKLTTTNEDPKTCRNSSVIIHDYYNYTLIGLFPAYVSAPRRILSNGIMYMETTKYVLQEFNEKSSFKVGFRFYDTCGQSHLEISTHSCLDILIGSKKLNSYELQSSCSCKNNHHLEKIVGVVGPSSSSVSQMVSNLLLPAKIPMISYSSTSVELNNKELFPYFMRTIAADDHQVKLIFDLVTKFNWKYVSLLASDNLYGRSGTSALYDLFKANGICFGVNRLFKVPYDSDEITGLVKLLKKEEKAEVVIVWAVGTPSGMILKRAANMKLHSKTWIFTEGVGNSRILLRRHPNVVRGAFSILPISGYNAEFEEYFYSLTYPEDNSSYIGKHWLRKYFTYFKATERSLWDFKSRFHTHKIGLVRNSVKAYLHALKAYVQDHGSTSQPFPGIHDRNLFFHNYLKKVNFTALNGDYVNFDEQGNVRNPFYKVLNVKANKSNIWYEEIGYWKENTGLRFTGIPIMWSNDTQPQSVCSDECPAGTYPIQLSVSCCWKCVPCKAMYFKNKTGQRQCTLCPKGTIVNNDRTRCYSPTFHRISVEPDTFIAIVALVVLSGICMISTVILFLYHRRQRIVKASSLLLSVIQLFMQFLTSLCGILLCFKTSLLTCMTYHYVTGVSSIILFCIILMKANLLLRIFKARHRLSKVELTKEFKRQVRVFLIVLTTYGSIHVALCIFYPFKIEEETQKKANTVILYCSSTSQSITTSVFLFILSLLCSFQMFQNRKLPSLYNESRNIMYALFLLDVGIFFILMVGVLVRSRNRSFVIYFCIYSINMAVFTFMFGNKVLLLLKKDFIKTHRVSAMRSSLSISGMLQEEKGEKKTQSVPSNETHSGSTERTRTQSSCTASVVIHTTRSPTIRIRTQISVFSNPQPSAVNDSGTNQQRSISITSDIDRFSNTKINAIAPLGVFS